MDKLTVVGVEDDVLVVETESGDRFAIDVASLPEIRKQQPAAPQQDRKASPREIQAAMRGGKSADEVASETGEDLEYIRRYEGPVTAERNHILDQALSIAVASGDLDPLASETTFGSAITARLADLGATDEQWFAWKEHDGGWSVRLTFEASGVEHDARWNFEPKKATLVPRNKEATALSQQGDATSVLVPRLRAIDTERATSEAGAPAEGGPGADGRFDSGAFHVSPQTPSRPVTPSRPHSDQGVDRPARNDTGSLANTGSVSTTGQIRGDITRGSAPSSSAQQPDDVQQAAISRTPKPATQPNHTADLLDALRRRRGEREAALAQAESQPIADADSEAKNDSTDPALFDVDDRPGVHHTSPLTQARPKRGARASMPSWDEIVLGSRGDDEPA